MLFKIVFVEFQVAVEYIVNCAEIDRCPARMLCAYRCEDCGICSHHFTCTCQTDQVKACFAYSSVSGKQRCRNQGMIIMYAFARCF